MSKVYSLQEAMEWFLSHSNGSVICVSGDKEQECQSYKDAQTFYEDGEGESLPSPPPPARHS